MSCEQNSFEVYVGDIWTRTFTWPTGTNLTGYTFDGVVAENADAAVVASHTFDTSSLASGSVIASVSFSGVEPGLYKFWIRYTDTLSRPLTFFAGEYLVKDRPA